jgi:predicted transcriptional regulator
MELHFTPEQEAQLAQVAQHAGKPVEQCLTDAALAMLHERDVFLAVVEKGIAAADRGEFVDDDEVRRWLEERERS